MLLIKVQNQAPVSEEISAWQPDPNVWLTFRKRGPQDCWLPPFAVAKQDLSKMQSVMQPTHQSLLGKLSF